MRKLSFDFEAEYFSLRGDNDDNGDKQAADDTKDRSEDVENSDLVLEEGTDELSRKDDNSTFEDSITNLKKGNGDTGYVKFEDLTLEEKKPQDEGKGEEKLSNVAHAETQAETNSEKKSVARRLELSLSEMQEKGNKEGWQDGKEADNLQKSGAQATVSVNIKTDDDQVSDLNTAAKAFEAEREFEDSDRKADKNAFVLAADENNEETSERETKSEDQDLTKELEDIPGDRAEAEVVHGLMEQKNERSADAEVGNSKEHHKDDDGTAGTTAANQKYEDGKTDMDR